MCSLLLFRVTALTFLSTKGSSVPIFAEVVSTASSAQFSNSTDLQISPDLFWDREGPYKNKYSIRPRWEIFDTMKLLWFLSGTLSLCDAEDAQKRVGGVEIKTSDLDVVFVVSPCSRERKLSSVPVKVQCIGRIRMLKDMVMREPGSRLVQEVEEILDWNAFGFLGKRVPTEDAAEDAAEA